MSRTAVLPIPRSLHGEPLLLAEDGLTILASADATDVRCPVCGDLADRVHRRDVRTLADLPWAGVAVRVRVPARRFCCANDACPRTIFAERLAGIAPAFAPRTDRQRDALAAIAVALGGEAGARLAASLGDPVRPDTLVRLVRGAGSDEAPAPTVRGVDDWALRKGRRSGTILVDRERHRPVDLVPDRTAETRATWLTSHPGVRLVSRDRSGAAAEGLAAGAPAARPVADRWHLLAHLRAAVPPVLERHRARLPAVPVPAAAAAAEAAAPPPAAPDRAHLGRDGRLPARPDHLQRTARAQRRAPYERAVAWRERGWTVRRIARAVGISERTVNRWCAAGRFPERKRRAEARRLLHTHRPSLDRRGAAGCHTVARLCRELRDQGYPGSCPLVDGAAACLRPGIPPPGSSPPEAVAAPPAPPLAPRQVVWLLRRAPAKLAEPERPYRDDVRQADPALATVVDRTRRFVAMVRDRQADCLDDGLRAARAGGIAELQGLAAGLERDKASVAAALAERWSNGQTQGQGLRLKRIKRQGYGRATFDLLRQRVLRAA